MNIIPYLSALHAATLMFILQKINSVQLSFSICLTLRLLFMSELKYDGDPSEPELYKNFIISIDSEQPNKTILLSLHTL